MMKSCKEMLFAAFILGLGILGLGPTLTLVCVSEFLKELSIDQPFSFGIHKILLPLFSSGHTTGVKM